MKILMTCTPGLGHFHPMAPLAHALRAAGHDVTFVTSESFRPWIERAGLPAVTSGADWIQSAPERAFPDLPGSPYQLQDLITALTHGVPSVLLPLGSDQFYNAFRVAACGAGLALDRSHLTSEDVRRAARTVLDEPSYRFNAKRLAREIEAMPAPADVVGLLEKLARDKTPIPATVPAAAGSAPKS